MAQVQAQKFCKVCDRPTLHAKQTFGAGWGLLITVLTMGLFLPLWLIIILGNAAEPMLCQSCGSKANLGEDKGMAFVIVILIGLVAFGFFWLKYGY